MKTTFSLKALLACGALLAGLWASEAQAATGTFEKSMSIDEAIVLDVSTGSGSISIRGGSDGNAKVIGKIKVGSGFFKRSSEETDEIVRDFESNPPVVLEDGRLLVGHIKDKRYRNNVSISYEIVVPVNTEVVSRTGSGSQTVADVGATVSVKTGSGGITLADIGGSVTASSGSGTIKAERIAGEFKAKAGSGSIRMTQVAPGNVDVTTGSGSSELKGVVGSLRVKAGSGRITVDGRQEGDWNIDTGSGSVSIDLPDDAAFDLDAETGSGGINVDHPVTVQGKISKRHLRGEVRGGGNSLRVETGSGGIRIQ